MLKILPARLDLACKRLKCKIGINICVNKKSRLERKYGRVTRFSTFLKKNCGKVVDNLCMLWYYIHVARIKLQMKEVIINGTKRKNLYAR